MLVNIRNVPVMRIMEICGYRTRANNTQCANNAHTLTTRNAVAIHICDYYANC